MKKVLLKKVISGGQTGADLAGVYTAQLFGFETGGTMPAGFFNQTGKHPEFAQMFNMKEHSSSEYAPRTYDNARNSDGTVRFAADFNTAGEQCTMKAIITASKPSFDVNLLNPPPVEDFINWLKNHEIATLNVAGNSAKRYDKAFKQTVSYLSNVFFTLGYSCSFSQQDVIRLLGFSEFDVSMMDDKGNALQRITLSR